jgi:hypothetical protein
MGLADDLESNLDELYQETVRADADDAFAVAIAASVRRLIGASAPTLQIVRRADDEPHAQGAGDAIAAIV